MLTPPTDSPAEATYLYTLKAPERLAPAIEGACMRVLSPEERARLVRFRVESAAVEYLTTRAFARWVLSRHTAIEPAALSFWRDERGRPYLAGDHRGVTFNLSHTRGLIACLVGFGRSVGVDVEDTTRRLSDMTGLARGVFSDGELAVLTSEPNERKRQIAFFRHWTLKEAVAKAEGMGLSMPFSELSFCFDGPEPKRWPPRSNERPWQLGTFSCGLGDRHVGAFAIDATDGQVSVIRKQLTADNLLSLRSARTQPEMERPV